MMSENDKMGWSGTAPGILPILSLMMGLLLTMSPMVQGAQMEYIKYHSENPETPLAVKDTGSSYQYLKTEFVTINPSKDYIVTGAHFIYSTTTDSVWRGKIVVSDQTSDLDYQLTLPLTYGDPETYHENFNGPEFMIVTGMFSIAMFPADDEDELVQMWHEGIDGTEEGHTYIWYNEDGWMPLKDLQPLELIMSAMVEPVEEIDVGEEGRGGSMDSVDNLDLYEVLLVGGKTYTFELDNPGRDLHAFRLYEKSTVISNPLEEKTGINEKDVLVYTPPKDGYYYFMVEYPDNDRNVDYNVMVKTNNPPEANIQVKDLVEVNSTVRFSAANSTDQDGDDISYSWDFDSSDGIQEDSTRVGPTHIYRESGTYTITLTVDDGMQNDTITTDIRVNAPPKGDFTIKDVVLNETTRLNFDQSYTFVSHFTDADDPSLEYEWDFGDGGTAVGPEVVHTFEQKGNYTICVELEVRDSTATVTVSKDLTFNRLPEARLDELRVIPRKGKMIEFEAYGRDTDGYIEEYRWDFNGDGEIDKVTDEPFAEHVYKQQGTYNASFYVVDDNGGVGRSNMTVDVKKKAVEEEDNTLLMIGAGGGMAGLVIALLVIWIFVLKPRRQGEDDGTGSEGQGHGQSLQEAEEPVTGQQEWWEKDAAQGPQAQEYPATQEQQVMYGQQPQRHQKRGPKPIPGQKYKTVTSEDGEPSLVPPPSSPKGGPKLVPPPKPGQKSGGPGQGPSG